MTPAGRAGRAPGAPCTRGRGPRRARRRGEIVTARPLPSAPPCSPSVGVLGSSPDPVSPTPQPTCPQLITGIPTRSFMACSGGCRWRTTWRSVLPPSRSRPLTDEPSPPPPTHGVFHRLDPPGFDAEVYDDPKVRRTGMGRALPDWDALCWPSAGPPAPDETGQELFVSSGLRILRPRNGRSGRARGPRTPGRVRRRHRQPGLPMGSRALRDALVTRRSLPLLRAPPVGCSTGAGPGGRARAAGQGGLPPTKGAACSSTTPLGPPLRRPGEPVRPVRLLAEWLWAMDGWPRAVGDDGNVRPSVSINNTADLASLVAVSAPSSASPAGRPTTSTPSSRRSRQAHRRDPGTQHPPARGRPPHRCPGTTHPPPSPVRVDLLGWIGPDHAMAQVSQPGFRAEPPRARPVRRRGRATNLAAPFDDEGTDSTFSFATGLATVAWPTYDFNAAAAADRAGEAGSPPLG